MRAVAVVVARGVELPRALRLDALVAAPGLVEVAGADDLAVAGVVTDELLAVIAVARPVAQARVLVAPALAVVVAAMVWIVAPGTVGTLRLLRDDL